VVVAAHQRLATVFSDSPPGLEEEAASVVEAVAHRQQPFRTDLSELSRLLQAGRLPGS
jgi:hypothetical protein